MDNRKNIKIISWNVNSLHKRATDLHAYVLSNDIDIIALQEVGIKAQNHSLKGYQRFELAADLGSNTRGLVSYVKDSIPATLLYASKKNGIEYICINVHVDGGILCFVNIYVHANSLVIEDLPDVIFSEICLLVGDLNARHPYFGSTGGTHNTNGVVLKSFLDATENVKILGDIKPTHVKGGRLDYAILFNMDNILTRSVIVPELLSDHFAIRVDLYIDKLIYQQKRKRYVFKDSKHRAEFCRKIEVWCKEYKKCDIKDENVFYEDLLHTIESILDRPESQSRNIVAKKKPDYCNDNLVKGWGKILRKCQSKWNRDPTDDLSKNTMLKVAEVSTQVKQKARSEYWNEFLGNIASSKSLRDIWNRVNKVRGVKKKMVAHPNPKLKANELMKNWANASSIESLPRNVQNAIMSRRYKRRQLVNNQSMLWDDSCVPITTNELLFAVKKGKSTAPGADGLTYDVLNCLIMMRDSPLLDLFNLSYENGRLPVLWKTALIMPTRKGDSDFRPISLTSCLCKMMERVILNRLIYKIKDLMSDNMYGFMKGKSTSDCVISALSNADVQCRVFVDLKGAFDKANKDVILEELVSKGIKGKLLRWIADYLSDRKARVWFQGFESDEHSLELGTPQGGVLSPLLFNVLMDKIARHSFADGTQIVIYADDILIQCRNEELMNKALTELQNLCLYMGLVINERKTKYQSRVMNSRGFMLNNVMIEKVSSYKYLGMHVSLSTTYDHISHVKNICLARLSHLGFWQIAVMV